MSVRRADDKPRVPREKPKTEKKTDPRAKPERRSADLVAREGDTLQKIALRSHLALEDLQRANPKLADCATLRAGEKVLLPSDAYEQPAATPLSLAADTSSAKVAQIDPRLLARGDFKIVPRSSGPAGEFDVAQVAYQDDDKSGGRHNVYVRVLDASGREIPPDQLEKWFDVRYVSGSGQPEQSGTPKLNDRSGVGHDGWETGENGGSPSASYFDVPLWGNDATQVWLAPKNVPGNPYAGFGTQQVGPFTMPGHHHVDYLVTFQAVPKGAQPVAPPVVPSTASTTSTPSTPSTDGAARIASYASGKDIGQPTGAATDLPGVGTMQRYAGGGATEGECAILDSAAGGTHLVKNAFYRTLVQGDTAARLGAPLSDEGWEGGAYVQKFEHGRLTWADGKVSAQFDAPAATPAVPPPPPAAPPAGDARLAELLAKNPDIKTNQDLINYFYRVGGNNWNGAVATASGFGVDLAALTKNRSAQVSGASTAAPVVPPPAPAKADLGDMVETVYQEVLGRASDPGGKANWTAFADRLRSQGSADKDIKSALVAMFKQSDEYLRKSPTSPTTPTGPGTVAPVDPTAVGPVGAPGSVYGPLEIAPGVKVNGRLGFDWRNDQYDSDMNRAQQIIDKAKALGAGYCTLLVDPTNPEANAALIAKLQQNGITPVVRMYLGGAPDTWSDDDIKHLADCAQKLTKMGVKLIQVGNEPNIEGHLKDRGMLNQKAWDKYLADSCAKQAQALLAVKRAVGDSAMVGIPPVAGGSPDKVEWGSFAAETYYPALLHAIKDVEQLNKMKICDWIPTHTYDMDTPGTSPGPDTARGHLGNGPVASTWFEDQAASILGRRMRSLSTEGGAEPNAFRSDPKRTEALMQESMDQLQGNKNLTNCLWLLYDDEGMKSGNWGAWNKMALWDDAKNWSGGLDDYRQDYDKAKNAH